MSFGQTIQAYNRKKRYHNQHAGPALVEDYYNMQKIFQKNAWITYPGYSSIYEAHVELMRKLTADERKLYLELIGRFFWIRDYTKDIIEQLNQILGRFHSYSTYNVLRCMPIKDQKWSKSSGVVLYEIKNPEVRKQLVKPIHILDRMEDVEDISDIGNSFIILVDDFVGTGDTVEKCLKDLEKKNAAVMKNIAVMCVAALERGKQKLSELKVPLFASHILKRGISDYYSGYALTRKIQLMQQIEDKLHVSKDFRFGYGGSESLICLKRCPNNTFPIFWHDRRYSPYPRY